MSRAERDAAVEKVVWLLTGLFNEHVDACKADNCPTTREMEDALKALYSLRKGR